MEFLSLRQDAARSRLGSDLVLVGDWAFLSGVLPIDLGDDRLPLPEMVEAQTLRVLANAETLLKAAGLTREHIASVRISIANFAKFYERVNDAYVEFFAPDRLPTRSCAGVTHLPRGALVGMDFIACRQAP
jgi:2-iminobutanoate/2-iminopropanoate deaminase